MNLSVFSHEFLAILVVCTLRKMSLIYALDILMKSCRFCS